MNTIKLEGCPVGDGYGPCTRGCSGWNHPYGTEALQLIIEKGNLDIVLINPKLCDVLEGRIIGYQKSAELVG